MRAAFGSISGESLVYVVPGDLASISVTPESLTVQAGSTAMIHATARDEYGNQLYGAWLDVHSERGGIMVVRDMGTYISYSAPTVAGSDTVTVSSGDISKTVQITVSPGILYRIVVPTSLVLEPGQEVLITVHGLDIYGNEVSLEGLTWSCSLGSLDPAQDGLSAIFTAGSDAGAGNITIAAADGTAARIPVFIKGDPRTLVDDLTSGPAIALLMLVIVLAGILLVLFMKTRGGGNGREPSGPETSEPPQSGPGTG